MPLLPSLDTKTAYVYGWDEQPISCEPKIRAMFGAVKAKWPFVATVAVLNWAGGLPADLPVDVWVLQYEDYNAAQAAQWRKAGKKQFWYHCIEPSGTQFLNTFIERPWIQGRLLYWLAAANDVDGWLYYADDLWIPHPGRAHTPIQRISDTPLTNWDPANYVWSPRTDIFANGDGQFIYPGPTGPVVSARLLNMRDAVEDQQLLSHAKLAAGNAAVDALIAKLVRGPEDHTDNPTLLEATRRQIAILADMVVDSE